MLRNGHCRAPGGGPQGGISRAAHPNEGEFKSKSRVRFELKAAINPGFTSKPPPCPDWGSAEDQGGWRWIIRRHADLDSGCVALSGLGVVRDYETQGGAMLALGYIIPPRRGWRLAH